MRQCEKCSQVPCLNPSCQYIYISFGVRHLYDKIVNLLKDTTYPVLTYPEYLRVEVVDFPTFVRFLDHSASFSSVEKKDIFLLPLSQDDLLDFGHYPKVHDLNYWTYLFENEDVVSALEHEWIQTLFQPILHNKTLEVYAHESLSRAYTEDGEQIGAGRLFTAGKKLGLSFNLDRQCRINAIRTAARTPGHCGKLFINFIPSVIYDPNVCLKTTHEVIRETGLKPEDIVFEVVESDFVDDYEHLADILNHYREKGYQTALDDVGSGYSTLSKFDILNTDYIKVDMGVIAEIHCSTSAQAYLDQILELKKRTGVKILAEGIETQEVYDYLKNTEVDFLQGYLFARPKEGFL